MADPATVKILKRDIFRFPLALNGSPHLPDLVARPEIYLFDDSFSALDLGTDARLRAALRPVTADAAVIIVAQRVSTILDADEILVLDDGRIVGRGRHDELLESCPTYAEIVASQLTTGVTA